MYIVCMEEHPQDHLPILQEIFQNAVFADGKMSYLGGVGTL